jgi:phytanoyl-CoA hydroxylase
MLLESTVDLDVPKLLSVFARDGYARLGPVLSSQAVSALRVRANALMLGEIEYPGLFYQHDSSTGRYEDLVFGAGWVGPSLSYRKLEKLELDPLFEAWIENPLFGRIARAALGDRVSLYRSVLWNKAPRTGMELPWHQDDGAFWGLDRSPSLQIWTALDDAPVGGGCLEVVPGSHLGGMATPLGGTVAEECLEAARAEARSLPLPVAAGEALLIHNHVWHRSKRNETERPRRAIGISYLDAATRCQRRKRAPRNFRRVFEDGPATSANLSKNLKRRCRNPC